MARSDDCSAGPEDHPEAAFPDWLGEAGRALAATAVGSQAEIGPAYRRALTRGAPPPALAEVAAMAHLFAGFPRAIQALAHFQSVLEQHGLRLPLIQLDEAEAGRDQHRERGQVLFSKIYATESSRVLEKISQCLGGYQSWVLEHAYGRVLSRPGLEGVHRELLAVAALAALDCPAQWYSHARGALRLGAKPAWIEAMLAAAEGLAPPEALKHNRAMLRQIETRNGASDTSTSAPDSE